MIRVLIIFILMGKMMLAIKLSPPIIHQEFDNGVLSETIEITNNSRKAKRYLIEVLEADEYRNWSLENEIRVFPRILLIEPKKSKSIRVRVKKVGLEDGEYKGYIRLKELPIKRHKKNEDNGIKAEINILKNFKVSVYGRYGEIDNSVDIDWSITENEVISNIKSIGNAGRSIGLRLIAEGEVVFEKPVCRIMRREVRVVTTKLPVGLPQNSRLEYFDLASKKIIE